MSANCFSCVHLIDSCQVWYEGFEAHNWDGGNYMCGPEFWGLLARRGKGGLWRVTYGDVAGFFRRGVREAASEGFEKLLPGPPEAG